MVRWSRRTKALFANQIFLSFFFPKPNRNYLYFILHLRGKPVTEYTGNEQFVADMLRERRGAEILPLNKAMSLAGKSAPEDRRHEALVAALHNIQRLLEAQADRDAARARQEADSAWISSHANAPQPLRGKSGRVSARA